MSIKVKYFSLSIVFAIIVLACERDPAVPEPILNNDISFSVPAGWPQPVYNFQNNTLSNDGFALGRKLFYDTRLSADNSTSCGSCHQQFAAFANSAHTLSHGINGLLGTRNSPALFNTAWLSSFMWDGGINHIEVQPFGPITNPVEMGENMNNVISKIENDINYKALFKKVYGTDSVNSQRIFKALAQFMGAMVSSNSKYDKVTRGEDNQSFTADEQAGLNLFQQKKCANCHKPPLFTTFEFRNNGLSVNTNLQDSGRAHITGDPNDRYKFKIPSLRNVAVSGPYMHDGRYQTLNDCLNHYTSNIVNHPTLDTSFTNPIILSTQEKQQIISFLNTLTDNDYLHDVRFKDPN